MKGGGAGSSQRGKMEDDQNSKMSYGAGRKLAGKDFPSCCAVEHMLFARTLGPALGEKSYGSRKLIDNFSSNGIDVAIHFNQNGTV